MSTHMIGPFAGKDCYFILDLDNDRVYRSDSPAAAWEIVKQHREQFQTRPPAEIRIRLDGEGGGGIEIDGNGGTDFFRIECWPLSATLELGDDSLLATDSRHVELTIVGAVKRNGDWEKYDVPD